MRRRQVEKPNFKTIQPHFMLFVDEEGEHYPAIPKQTLPRHTKTNITPPSQNQLKTIVRSKRREPKVQPQHNILEETPVKRNGLMSNYWGGTYATNFKALGGDESKPPDYGTKE
ncbi:hypothetical protein BgiMline_013377 [Biomphalaria glabrata]|nr:hypothetical protein BgiMline_017185 [Biomphalaria glabrata]